MEINFVSYQTNVYKFEIFGEKYNIGGFMFLQKKAFTKKKNYYFLF